MFQAMDRLLPLCDPDNMGEVINWVTGNMNEMQLLFQIPLLLDVDRLVAYAKEQKQKQEDMQQQTIDGQVEPGEDDEKKSGNKSIAQSGGANVVKLPGPSKVGA